jgi:hypothetical protein
VKITVEVTPETVKRLKEIANEKGIDYKRLGGDIIKIQVYTWKPDL